MRRSGYKAEVRRPGYKAGVRRSEYKAEVRRPGYKAGVRRSGYKAEVRRSGYKATEYSTLDLSNTVLDSKLDLRAQCLPYKEDTGIITNDIISTSLE